ncbi:glycosyltransferase [Salinicoccus siamensis]|uniref:Glycosyltransferase n=1 Tax=Salinicoccus siamensis TaxID=381830 RepID=A0ABV5Z4R5_9STAP
MNNVFMIVHELNVNKGGMTTAMLTRSKMFHANNVNANIVTFDYKVNYDNIIHSLMKQDKMSKNTKMFNLFQYYEKKSSSKKIKHNKKLYNLFNNFFKDTIEIKEDKKTSKFLDKTTGQYKARKKLLDSEQTIVDLYNNNKRYRRVHLKNEKIHRINIFNYDNKVLFETFYDRKGFPYISRNINPKNGNVGVTYLLVDKIQFSSNLNVCSHFLREIVKDNSENIMICDGPGSFPRMLNTSHKNAKKFAVIHVNHYKNFNTDGSKKIKEDYIINNADNIDGVIVLTDAQRKDIKEEYSVNNIYAISNFINNFEKESDFANNKIVGHISRIVATKGVHHLIDVAELVVKEDEEVEFHIYGEGPEKDRVRKLINKKNLNDNVKLLGYTSKPQQVINQFQCVLSTSQYEGQGLSMIEAMLLQRPVIAFDINYGPNEFIKNDINGYLIPNLDIQEMADKILELVNDDDLTKKLGKEARNTIIEKYSSEKIMDKWQVLFDK